MVYQLISLACGLLSIYILFFTGKTRISSKQYCALEKLKCFDNPHIGCSYSVRMIFENKTTYILLLRTNIKNKFYFRKNFEMKIVITFLKNQLNFQMLMLISFWKS